MSLWDRLLPQTEMTLNFLRPARVAPNVSAHAYMHGQHHYNSHPLVPLGMEVEMHAKPEARDTWATHSVSGYNVGTSFEHYRCYQVWTKDTHSVRVGNTVFFKHKYLTMPTITPGDAVVNAAEDLKRALIENISQGIEAKQGIEQLMKIFKQQREAKSKEQTEKLREAANEAKKNNSIHKLRGWAALNKW